MKIYDLIGVGIGPFNLGMAALAHDIDKISTLFVDKQEQFNWHPGLMLDEATLQVPFMADLVTMADPCSRFSFLNYLKQNNRLYKFYIREDFFVLRKEYNKYCQWVISQLNNCRFGSEVVQIVYDEDHKVYKILLKDIVSGDIRPYYARRLVFGTGTQPYVPAFAKVHNPSDVCHTSEYLQYKSDFENRSSISIVGSGQSAAEIFYDLLQSNREGLELNWFTRADRFYPMEYSKLTLELTSPEYVDHFYGLPSQKRASVLKEQNPLYKGINYDLINAIYDRLYQMSVDNSTLPVRMQPCSELVSMSTTSDKRILLHFNHTQMERGYAIATDAVILATGYKAVLPSFVEGIKDRISWLDSKQFNVSRDYSIDSGRGELFVQNAELPTHGFVTPDLGMGAYRNSVILNKILGYEHYLVEKSIAFQSFSASPLVEAVEAIMLGSN